MRDKDEYNFLAPKTCRGFMDLAERNFYDETIFHRVIVVNIIDYVAAAAPDA